MSVTSDIPDRVDSAFREVVSQTPNSQLFKESVFSNPIDLQEVKKSLSYTTAEQIEETYLQILDGKIAIPIASKAPLLELLLRSGDISESGKKKIFDASSNTLSQMDERFLVDLFTSFDPPIESKALSLVVKGEGTGQDLFRHSWNNNLQGTLFYLIENPFFSQYFGSILEEIKSGITAEKIELVLLILPYIGSASLDQLFHYFDNLSAQELDVPRISEFKNAFFFSDFIKSYFTSADFQPSLDQLESGFKFYWEHVDNSEEKQMRLLGDVAQAIYRQDSSYFDRFITPSLKRGLTTKDFGTPLSAIVPCLGIDTTLQVEKQLMTLYNRAPNSMLTSMFFNLGKKSSLILWKHAYAESVRDLPFLSKGSQAGKDGTYLEDLIPQMFEQLNTAAPSSVWFNPAEKKTSLTGGVCSAMAFRSIKRYREQRKLGLSPIAAVQSIGDEFSFANASFRATQAVYNTINRKKDVETGDFKKDKIAALLQLENPDCTIHSCSEEIDFAAADSKEKITGLFHSIPDGIHFVRSLSPLKTEADKQTPEYVSKEERYGHSTYLIKEGSDSIYYDPALGFMQLTHPEQLDMILKWQSFRWGFSTVRMYEVV